MCSSTLYGMNSNFGCETIKCTGTHCNFSSATMNYLNAICCVKVIPVVVNCFLYLVFKLVRQDWDFVNAVSGFCFGYFGYGVCPFLTVDALVHTRTTPFPEFSRHDSFPWIFLTVDLQCASFLMASKADLDFVNIATGVMLDYSIKVSVKNERVVSLFLKSVSMIAQPRFSLVMEPSVNIFCR